MLRTYELGLILSMREDGSKDIQPVTSAWSICIQSLKLAFYRILKGVIRDMKRTLTQFSIQYEIQHFGSKLTILKITDDLTTDKLQATKNR